MSAPFKTQTRRGLDVEIVHVTDQALTNGTTYIGIITDDDGLREVNTWDYRGRFNLNGNPSFLDLVLPVKRGTAELAMAVFGISEEAWIILSVPARRRLVEASVE